MATPRPTPDDETPVVPHAVPTPGKAHPPAPALPVLVDAPTLVFDAAPVFAQSNGTLCFTLTTRRYLPDGQGGIVADEVVSGFLRCSPQSALALKTAIDGALLMTRPTTGNLSN